MEEIKITINGRELTGSRGETILQIAVRNGIEIPNLCYNKNLKVYGACGLCVVERENFPKLLRACATEAADGMVIFTNTPRVKQARKIALELLMSDHRGDCKGPCHLNCPAGTDIQAYLKQIALGNDMEAVRIIKEKLPFPSSLGRVCPHPCEAACRRQNIEESLSVAFLKAFAGDNVRKAGHYIPVPAPRTGKKIGVIGGGPAGLSVAYFLALKGHSVTVTDAMPRMGGMLRYGIPEYRLPRDVLDDEINEIASIGILMENNRKLGRDFTLEEYRARYDAVVIAVGAWKSMPIGCVGEGLEGVQGGIDFLRKAAMHQPTGMGERVAVVGGGNVAMDACRTAIRLGAKKVYNIYRRTREEMPAEDIEITEAMEEGVEFKFLTNPAEIIGEDGKVTAIKLQVMQLGEPDESGRRKPMPVPGEYMVLEVDTVIGAIGQKLNPMGLDQVGLTRKGTIAADENSFLTSLEGVFAVGDATNKGASIAAAAVGEANRAVDVIDAYLTDGEIKPYKKPFYSERHVTPADYIGRDHLARVRMAHRHAEDRKNDFDEVNLGLSESEARMEARRCLECGCHDYEDCRLIHYANQEPIKPERFAGDKHEHYHDKQLLTIERDQGKCILCNLCVRTCREEVGKGLLGLVGRGFGTVIRPEFKGTDAVAGCKDCHKCADYCPTGALKIL